MALPKAAELPSRPAILKRGVHHIGVHLLNLIYTVKGGGGGGDQRIRR